MIHCFSTTGTPITKYCLFNQLFFCGFFPLYPPEPGRQMSISGRRDGLYKSPLNVYNFKR